MNDWLLELWRRFRFLIARDQFERDLEEEMRLQKDLREEQYRNLGIDRHFARLKAQRQFGNDMLLKEVSHEIWGWPSLERCWQDRRYAGFFVDTRGSHEFAGSGEKR